ncbi:hypothetical protein Maq22A_c12305 [Methylobacterium aquaticum]|uniref:Uncharacterized protein n=1 Tax=Methylobacterium aquaticum TaxID=270351 RepID=A0A0C6FFE7_9HYPH|nr:hypothetical protein Maq22A_c12305 [Methylobacterium aquaticum]
MRLQQGSAERVPVGMLAELRPHREPQEPAARRRRHLAGAIGERGGEQAPQPPTVVAALGDRDRLGERRWQPVRADEGAFEPLCPLARGVAPGGLGERGTERAAQADGEDGGEAVGGLDAIVSGARTPPSRDPRTLPW